MNSRVSVNSSEFVVNSHRYVAVSCVEVYCHQVALSAFDKYFYKYITLKCSSNYISVVVINNIIPVPVIGYLWKLI